MPTQGAEVTDGQEQRGVGDAAKLVAEHASSIARLEIELATMELKRKLAALGIGIGMGLGAAIFLLFFLGFLFATIAVVLSIFLDSWLAMLIVTVGLLATAGTLGLLALGAIKKGSPPVPKQAIEEAKLTTQALKSNG